MARYASRRLGVGSSKGHHHAWRVNFVLITRKTLGKQAATRLRHTPEPAFTASGLPSGSLRLGGRWGGLARRRLVYRAAAQGPQAARARPAWTKTGENYTQALTALLSDTRLDPLPDG